MFIEICLGTSTCTALRKVCEETSSGSDWSGWCAKGTCSRPSTRTSSTWRTGTLCHDGSIAASSRRTPAKVSTRSSTMTTPIPRSNMLQRCKVRREKKRERSRPKRMRSRNYVVVRMPRTSFLFMFVDIMLLLRQCEPNKSALEQSSLCERSPLQHPFSITDCSCVDHAVHGALRNEVGIPLAAPPKPAAKYAFANR